MFCQLARHSADGRIFVVFASCWLAYFSSQNGFAVIDSDHEATGSKTRVLATQSFCGSLAKTIIGVLGETYKINAEISPSHLLALQNRLLKELTQENGASFVDIAAMTPEQPDSVGNRGETVLPLARILGPAMGLGNHVLLAYTFDELKYLPFTQMGAQILLISADPSSFGLNKMADDRIRLITETAKKLKVKISLLSLRAGRQNTEDMGALANLASITGGQVVAIDAKDQGCGKLL